MGDFTANTALICVLSVCSVFDRTGILAFVGYCLATWTPKVRTIFRVFPGCNARVFVR